MENYDDRFDCDPADCNIGASALTPDFGADEPVDNDSETASDFDVDGQADYDSEAADDFGVDESTTDETAAVDDRSFGADYGTSDDGSTGNTDLSDLYESSVPEEANDGCGCGYGKDGRKTNSPDESGYVDPSNETAATCDESCGCGTTYAQKKCALDDYEIISDVLGNEKQLVKLYSTALCESAEEPLRDLIKENLIEAAADQFATFEYMEKRGMYNVEQADEQEISQAKQQFCPLCD